jgi:hypothetical protein
MSGKPQSESGKLPKPSKPSLDFPLFPHDRGKWAKEIKGKLHYFGRWEDPDAALAEYQKFLADGVLGVGFVLPFADSPQACIAWPDTVPDRIYVSRLEQAGIEDVTELMRVPAMDLAEPPELDGKPPELEATGEAQEPSDPTLSDADLLPSDAQTTVSDADPATQTDAHPTLSDAKPHDAELEQALILEYLTQHGTEVTNKSVIAALKAQNIVVTSPQVTAAKSELKSSQSEPQTTTEPSELPCPFSVAWLARPVLSFGPAWQQLRPKPAPNLEDNLGCGAHPGTGMFRTCQERRRSRGLLGHPDRPGQLATLPATTITMTSTSSAATSPVKWMAPSRSSTTSGWSTARTSTATGTCPKRPQWAFCT